MATVSTSSSSSSLVEQENEATAAADQQPPRSINQLIGLMQQFEEKHNDHEAWDCPDTTSTSKSKSIPSSHSHHVSSEEQLPAIEAPANKDATDVNNNEITLEHAQSKWREVLALVSAMQFGINLMIISMDRISASSTSNIYGESFVVVSMMFTSAGRDKFGRILETAEKAKDANSNGWGTAKYLAVTLPIFLLITVTELWYMFILFFRYTPELIFSTFDQQSSLVLNGARVLAASKVFVMCIGFTLPFLFQDSTTSNGFIETPPRASSVTSASRLSKLTQPSV